jgi:hypothetical protein
MGEIDGTSNSEIGAVAQNSRSECRRKGKAFHTRVIFSTFAEGRFPGLGAFDSWKEEKQFPIVL